MKRHVINEMERALMVVKLILRVPRVMVSRLLIEAVLPF